jgi:hypothetical protein
MAKRTLYLPVMIAAAVALSAVLQKSEAAFPGKKGRIALSADDRHVEGTQQIHTVNFHGAAASS